MLRGQRSCSRCLRCAQLGLVTMLSWLLHSLSSLLMVCAVSLGNFLAIIGHCINKNTVHNQTSRSGSTAMKVFNTCITG